MSESGTQIHARFASALFFAGAALLVFGNSAHPVDSDPSHTSRLDLATDTSWIVVHLAIAVGVIVVVGAFAALQRLIIDDGGEAYARFGVATALIGGTMLAIVFGGLDGYGTARLATEWDTATGAHRDMVEAAAIALDAADSGITALGIIAFFGFTFVAFGRAIVNSRIVATWLGWVAVLIGIAGFVAGVTFAVEGPTSLTINVLFRPVALAATIYFVTLAVALRRVRTVRRAESAQPSEVAGTPIGRM
jgi:hypothetical protein